MINKGQEGSNGAFFKLGVIKKIKEVRGKSYCGQRYKQIRLGYDETSVLLRIKVSFMELTIWRERSEIMILI
jgi:hypothetical protein